MKWIEVETEILDREELETIGAKNAEKEIVHCSFDPKSIEHFWECKEDGLNIFFKSGERIITKTFTYDEFKEILRKKSIEFYSETLNVVRN